MATTPLRRQKVIKGLQSFCTLEIVLEVCDLDDEYRELQQLTDFTIDLAEEESQMALDILLAVNLQRYLVLRRNLPKSIAYMNDILPLLGERDFRQEFRMSKNALFRIAGLISDHPIFRNNSHVQQTAAVVQLLVATHQLGHFGNAASGGIIAKRFGIGEGTVDLFIKRVIVALLSLEKKIARWPDVEEKQAIKNRIAQKSRFYDCIGFVDGTLIPLEYKPSMRGEDYFSRKKQYGIAAMIICDDQRRIRYGHCGFAGSAHDSRVYGNSAPGRHPQKFFAHHEYLLADSAYTCTSTVIPSYKKPAADRKENEIFNKSVAFLRIVVEHTIGILKGRFQSLRSVRTRIRSANDHGRVVLHFRACCVLHNLLMDDFYDENWTEEDNISVEENSENVFFERADGKNKRDYLKSIVID